MDRENDKRPSGKTLLRHFAGGSSESLSH